MKFLLSICITLLALPAMAGDFFILDIEDAHMKSKAGADTIKIKQEIKSQYPGVKLKGANLLSVMMVAKTRAGKGKARLFVGGAQGPAQIVGGSPAQFQQESDSSFDRVLFEHAGGSQGKWQVRLQGNFIVRQMVVEVGLNPMVKVKMNYHHLHIRTGQGDDDTLRLKAYAKQNYGINPKAYELKAVTLVAKSKKGKGRAQLKVGQQMSGAYTLAGTPMDFHYNEAWSYSRVKIENPKMNSQGVWQIKLKGNIKIKDVILHMKEK